MQIQHNLAALMASGQQGINSTNFKKTSEKLASGYKINRAADDAAGLSISEKLRWQIRGLKRSIENAEEGANFIQVADGAMSEIHSMLHRMRELAVQSLNDTNTPEDRAAMAAEFEQLQCEIDSINTETDYNTQPVFERYTDSYYKIEGNRKWTANQSHFIEDPNNNLHITLPADLYDPSDYTITVPSGNYTTQELIDEIENAFIGMADPENPGFSLEFTKDGFCDLVFQSEDGEHTEITSVDGYLSYLIYDNYSNNTSAGLLGTTQFEANYPLEIVANQNDLLSFRIEKRDGTLTNQIEIKIPPGKYDRTQMIDLLNDKLKGIPEAAGIVAKPYGDKSIQITGGTAASITSLKGNMFTIETGSNTLSSVFYDNICPGVSTSSAPYLRGYAYYNKDYTTGFVIDDTNDTLAFTLDPLKSTPDYIIQLPHRSADDPYVLDNSQNANNLLYELNKQLNTFTGGDVSARLLSSSLYINSTYVTHYYIQLESKTTGNVRFTFPSSSDPDETKVWNATYKTLFETTNASYVLNPSKSTGSNTTTAQLTGAASLTMPIKLDSQQLTLKINGTNYSFTIPNSSYASLSDLTSDMDKALKANPAFPEDLKDKISITSSGSSIIVSGKDDTINTIDVDHTGAYEQLFTRYGETSRYVNMSASGREYYQQGSTAPLPGNYPAQVTMPYAIPQDQITIDSTNRNFYIQLNNSYVSFNLDTKTYSRAELIQEINSKLSAYPVEASLTSDNKFVLTTTDTGSNITPYIYVNSNNGTIWKALLGTEERITPPTSRQYVDGTHTSYQGRYEFNTVTLNDTNRSFTITMSDGTSTTVTLDKDTPYTKEELCNLINGQLPADTVVASVNNGCIRLEAVKGGYNSFSIVPTNAGSFYQTILGKPYTSSTNRTAYNRTGSHSYSEPFIIGRQDIKNNEITIVSGINDKFTVDLNYTNRTDTTKNYQKELTCTIPPGTYSYDPDTDTHGITSFIQQAFQKQIDDDPNTKGLEIEVAIGKKLTSVTGAVDENAMSIVLKEPKDAITNKLLYSAPDGNYTLDGVRGTAAYFTFYKTSGSLEPSHIVGVQDITKGVDIGPDNNELTIILDGVDYTYTFPPDPNYTSDMIIDFLNHEFKNGPNPVPLTASVADGKLKIAYDILGPYEITNISGSAKGDLFFKERGRESVDALMLQVSANAFDGLELPRMRVGTLALGINSVTVSKTKNANKALVRLDRAIDLLSSKRSTYGALQNRIEHIVCNNGIAVENQQASESRIRDANMALEMIEYVKHQILMQASDAMLAQANQLPNIVLNLLR